MYIAKNDKTKHAIIWSQIINLTLIGWEKKAKQRKDARSFSTPYVFHYKNIMKPVHSPFLQQYVLFNHYENQASFQTFPRDLHL